MTDFLRDPPLTTVEDCDLDTAMDDMFRLGVRAFLVVRDLAVVGLITADDIRQSRRSSAARVAEVMTSAADMPAIDWLTLREAKVRDLLEIFEGANVHHLVVLETESTQRATVRGLVHRTRGGAAAPAQRLAQDQINVGGVQAPDVEFELAGRMGQCPNSPI